MKLKIKAKAILGAAAVMMGIFAPIFSASANDLIDAIERGKPDDYIISLAERKPKLMCWAWDIDRLLIQCGKAHLVMPLREIRYRFKYPFHDAVRRGDIGEIEYLLKKNPVWISTPDFHGDLPIFRVNSVATLEFLYRHGAGLNSVSEGTYHTPLIFEVGGKPNIVEFLLKNGADINARDKYGCTILHRLFSSLEGYEDVDNYIKSIELVMQYGGEKIINSLDNDKRTPLDVLYSSMRDVEMYYDVMVRMGSKEDARLANEACRRLRGLIASFKDKYGAQLNKYKIEGCTI